MIIFSRLPFTSPSFPAVAVASDSFSRLMREFHCVCEQYFRNSGHIANTRATSFQCDALLLCSNCSVIAGATGAQFGLLFKTVCFLFKHLIHLVTYMEWNAMHTMNKQIKAEFFLSSSSSKFIIVCN